MSNPDSEITSLQSELRDLRAKLETYKAFTEKFNERTEAILFHFFDQDCDLAVEDLMASFREKKNVCEAHLSDLRGRDMIASAGARPLPRYIDEPAKFTALYRITPRGTKWAMANRP